jgi:hypothetical protein
VETNRIQRFGRCRFNWLPRKALSGMRVVFERQDQHEREASHVLYIDENPATRRGYRDWGPALQALKMDKARRSGPVSGEPLRRTPIVLIRKRATQTSWRARPGRSRSLSLD